MTSTNEDEVMILNNTNDQSTDLWLKYNTGMNAYVRSEIHYTDTQV